PEIARSVWTPVLAIGPSFQLLSILDMFTPVPICMEGWPLVVAELLLEMRSVSLKESANSVRAALYAVVLTLAMLLRMTSISCWKFSSPLTPVESEVSISLLGYVLRLRSWGSLG